MYLEHHLKLRETSLYFAVGLPLLQDLKAVILVLHDAAFTLVFYGSDAHLVLVAISGL